MTTRFADVKARDTLVALASNDYDNITAYKDYVVRLTPMCYLCVEDDRGTRLILQEDDLGRLVGFEKS